MSGFAWRRNEAARNGARLGIQQTLNGIFRTRHAPDLFCDRNTTLDDFSGVRVLLLHNCPNFSSQNGLDTGRCQCANRWKVKSLTRPPTQNGSQSSALSWWQPCFAQSYSQTAL